MLWTIIVVLLILWLLGYFGGNISPRFPKVGSWIHVLIVIVVILVILQLLGTDKFSASEVGSGIPERMTASSS